MTNRDTCPWCDGPAKYVHDCEYCHGLSKDGECSACGNTGKVYRSTAHEDVRNALEIITSLINHLPDSKGTEDWEWCWNELRDYSQASVKEARKVAKDFVYEMINKYKSTDDQTRHKKGGG